MDENLIAIEPELFKEITDDIVLKGSNCAFDKEILNFKGNTTETDIGKKLYSYLEALCECSDLHMKHIIEPMQTALCNLKDSRVNADQKAADSIKTI